ncbi:hypothetical protein A6F65_01891 [Paraurantiacibacter namhicola]|uniref:DUF5655 domain-containing protein n=2 Tax=Paraurantiacibacter namhicola TaxID=645517 RepID=A0A1C7D9S7_9SPHN|nr:hypothetical protein A6F65_01891 [Paraurantiacibacter namhicola]
MATPEEQAASMIANLPDKTGKPLGEWLELVGRTQLDKHGKIVIWLKAEYGIGHGFANLIAAKALESDRPTDPVADQYSGAKAALKPIYDAIVAFAEGLGDDVEIAPKKASVSLRRAKQFALITPATKTRIDLGLALKGEKAGGRLETYNAMCSHRVRLQMLEDFDDDVKGWMHEAYSRAD